MNAPVLYKDLTSQAKRIAFLKERLAQDDRWIARGLMVIFNNQTSTEQEERTVRVHNGIGFKAQHAEILTSYALRLQLKNGVQSAYDKNQPFQLRMYFTEKQENVLRQLLPVYARQIEREIRNKQGPK
jgi:hypothetical protein